jgi:hypothetical protein
MLSRDLIYLLLRSAEAKNAKMYTKNKKKPQKIEEKCTPKIFINEHMKNTKNMQPKNTKKMKKKHRNCKNHTKNATNDISGITDLCVCFITAGPITKLFAWGEEESGGQVL